MRRGQKIFDEDFAANNSAPSGATDGASLTFHERGGDTYLADALTLVAKFTGSGTVASVTPYYYFPNVTAAWVPGALYALKATADSDGGAILDLPGISGASRVDVLISGLDADGVSIEIYHNEHSED